MKRILSLLSIICVFCTFTLASPFAIAAEYENFSDGNFLPGSRIAPRLVDNADILTDTQELNINALLDEISERTFIDVAILTSVSVQGDIISYSESYFEHSGFGFGENYDGILYLLDMENREQRITSSGAAINIFTDMTIEYIFDEITPELQSGNYLAVCESFISLCDSVIARSASSDSTNDGYYISDEFISLEPITAPNGKQSFQFLKNALISLAVGFVAAFIVVSFMKGKLKTVRAKSNASDYTKQGSFHIYNSNDVFLYSKVSKRPKPKPPQNNSHGGGSSVHTSSSGRTYGGGSRKF